MELFFLFLLIFLMAFALASGYPLAFALPGSAILSIFLAGLSGYLIEGNPNEYFISDGPFQWLNAGITNFRGVYWDRCHKSLKYHYKPSKNDENHSKFHYQVINHLKCD